MNREAIKRNAKAVIENNLKAAGDGKEFSTASIMDAERMLEISNIRFTEDEMMQIETSQVARTMACKKIKEKYGLSWSEFKMLYDCQMGER